MCDVIHGFIIGSVHERDRIRNVRELQKQLPLIRYEEAVYPAYTKVPFMNRLLDLSYSRTGHRLNKGELGCLLSHRRIWQKIVQSAVTDDRMFLVLESDSHIREQTLLQNSFEKVASDFDLFFWGAWEGHMKLFRSTRKHLSKNVDYGIPFIKTVYCTYGYSLNRKAAAYLLKQTGKLGYPVDQFKRFVRPGDLRIGGVQPELVGTTTRNKSYIQKKRSGIKEFFYWLILDCKNSLVCFFK
ncbi:MAG: glycosyltransferase family 25 protein [Chitinophagaceae bacterium]|nr:glycosyltransferase family 25 protein [Chitinophagaceae bacterium]MCA6459643.1 glycosyltransferase family 25 protein [Chitinophagaceae bacterium]MCA6464510.1 glycosyltransferase family 25 protein [Chitinophagaceae bacterium]